MSRPFVSSTSILGPLVLVVASICTTSSLRAGEIAWNADLSAAEREARATGKLVWVQFTAPWCGACRLMERNTFTDDRVKSVADARYLAVKLQSESNQALAAAHGLDSLPATLLLRPDGTVIDRVQGYAEPDWFANFLERNAKQAAPPPKVALAEPTPIPRRSRMSSTKYQRFEVEGYDPVCLVDGHILMAGFSSTTVTFDGKRYRFVSTEMASRFRKNPRRYTPINGGICPVSLVERGESQRGRAKLWVVYQGHLYLFATKADRLAFAKDPDRYERVGHFERLACSGCWATDRLSRAETGRRRDQDRAVSSKASGPRRVATALPSDSRTR